MFDQELRERSKHLWPGWCQINNRLEELNGKSHLESWARGNDEEARSQSYLSDASECCAECGQLRFPCRPDIRSKFRHLNELARTAIMSPIIPA